MKRKNIIIAFVIITLSATQIMALEFNVDKEITKEIKTTVTQELNTQTQKGQELPDYKSLNQQMINELEEAIKQNKGDGYIRFLEDYKEFLVKLNTVQIYSPANASYIFKLIKKLDYGTQYLMDDDRKKYVNFLCNQDRYFLKSKNSIVNISFLIQKGLSESSPDYNDYYFDLIRCARKQKPEKIKLHKNNGFWKFLNSSEYEKAVLEGFQSEAAAGK